MPLSTQPSTAEEEAFMARLLMDPPVTPTRNRVLPSHKYGAPREDSERRNIGTPNHQLYLVERLDIKEEMSGWDWDALSDYVPTPKKSCDSPRKVVPAESSRHVSIPSVMPKYAPDPCTRCLVQTVTDTWIDGVREKVRKYCSVCAETQEYRPLARPSHNQP